jgi:hypothetical protein
MAQRLVATVIFRNWHAHCPLFLERRAVRDDKAREGYGGAIGQIQASERTGT